MFDEEPDADPHGECRDEIHKQAARIAELEAMLKEARLELIALGAVTVSRKIENMLLPKTTN